MLSAAQFNALNGVTLAVGDTVTICIPSPAWSRMRASIRRPATTITHDGTDTIVLNGIALASLSATNFVFS